MADIDFGGSPTDPALVPLATATYLLALEDTGVGAEPLAARVVAASEFATVAYVDAQGWTYVKLASPVVSTIITNASSGLAFAPAANKRYEVEALITAQSAATGTALKPAFEWPTGLVDAESSGWLNAPSAVATSVQRFAISGDTTQLGTSVVTTADVSYLIQARAIVTAGATPSGNFGVTIATETGGTAVTYMAGSFLKYREIP